MAPDPEIDVPAAPSHLAPSFLLEAEATLSGAASVGELFARAAAGARLWFKCDHALVVSVEEQRLHAGGLPALVDTGSDLLRRRLVAEPLHLAPGSAEALFIRAVETARCAHIAAPSVLAQALGLENVVLGAVRPEAHVLALLVLDRLPDPATLADRQMVQVLASMVARRVEVLFLRQRMAEVASELRYLTASAQALVKESLESAVSLPSDQDGLSVFSLAGLAPASPAGDVGDMFTPRELSILREMAVGRSNREIAQTLHISPETVKKYVSRVMDKLGAANRADAAVRFLRMANPE